MSPGLIQILLLVLATFPSSAAARSWRDVVDPSMYRNIDLDVHKLHVTTERNPFVSTFPRPKAPPSEAPKGDIATTPTPSPTAVWGMVEQNGGCPEGQLLHEIRMVDAWGDGWGDTTLTITRMVNPENELGLVKKVATETGTVVTEIIPVREPVGDDPSFPRQIFQGSLPTGSEGFVYICMEPDKCYEVTAEGGLWQQEVTWGIRQVVLGVPREQSPSSLTFAKGGSPETCQISVDVNGERACPVTCGLHTKAPSVAPTTLAPTKNPTLPPTVLRNIIPDDPTSSPSTPPSDMPSLIPTFFPTITYNVIADESPDNSSGAPSDMPSLVPTSGPTEDDSTGGGLGGLGGLGGFGFGGGFRRA